MNVFLNKWYKNHALVYKILLFLLTTLFIVYLFPKTGKFKYSFEKGKPWQSENLYAPFNFAIKKSQDEIAKERREIEQGESLLNKLYSSGILDLDYSYDKDRPVILTTSNTIIKEIEYGNLYELSQWRQLVEKDLGNTLSVDFKKRMLSIFFDVIKPNVQLNKSLSEKALEEELSRISLTRGRIEKEQLIVSKGQVVEDNQYDILSSLKSEYESQVWNSANYNWVLIAYTLLVALALLMLLLFLRKYRIEVFLNNTKVTFIFFNIALMVFLSTLVINFNSQYIYVVPLCILPLVLKAFFDARLGLFTHVLTVLLLGFIVPNSYEYMFLQIIAGMVTILTVSELYKRANLFISVGQITFIYIIAYFAFFVIHEGQLTGLKWETFGLFVLCGLATLFVQPLIYIYEKIFGLVSDVSLLELSDTNTKLLKELSNRAPGTFHHSLNVANLAEASANEIGANAMLIRVGALYHDIGKMDNPTYFTENQSTGINPHDELSSKESAKIIIDHTIRGIEIAKKHNLPDRVIDFIRTHHGTSLVYYFYMKEKAENENVDPSDFTYPGPKPFSKETAILMMCDSVEAASKSLKEPTSTKINDFVENIINKQMESGQFLNADITFKEIQSIKKVLKHKLANIYHLRIEYPE